MTFWLERLQIPEFPVSKYLTQVLKKSCAVPAPRVGKPLDAAAREAAATTTAGVVAVAGVGADGAGGCDLARLRKRAAAEAAARAAASGVAIATARPPAVPGNLAKKKKKSSDEDQGPMLTKAEAAKAKAEAERNGAVCCVATDELTGDLAVAGGDDGFVVALLTTAATGQAGEDLRPGNGGTAASRERSAAQAVCCEWALPTPAGDALLTDAASAATGAGGAGRTGHRAWRREP